MLSATEIKAPHIVGVEITEDTLTLHLGDGRSISAPIDWYPRLVHATEQERQNFRLIGRGEGIHWPDLDEDLSVEGILEGLPSREGPESYKRWLESRKRKPNE